MPGDETIIETLAVRFKVLEKDMQDYAQSLHQAGKMAVESQGKTLEDMKKASSDYYEAERRMGDMHLTEGERLRLTRLEGKKKELEQIEKMMLQADNVSAKMRAQSPCASAQVEEESGKREQQEIVLI